MLIDLDAAPPPAPARSRRLPWRRLRIAAAAAAVLLLLGAAAAPPVAVVFPRVADTGGRSAVAVLLTPQALVTAHPASGGDEIDVVARPLAPGGPSWRSRLSLPARDSLRLSRSGSVLVVDDELTVRILDAATGRERWAVGPDDSALVTGDRVLLTRYDAAGASELRLAELETGRVRWSRPGEAFAAVLGDAGRYLFTLAADGRAEVRSAVDGRLLGSRPLNESVDPDDPDVAVVGERVYVLGPASVTALRLADLTPAWRSPARVPMPTGATRCGDLVCFPGERGLTAVDAGTGATRWSAPEWVAYSGGVASARDRRTVLLDPATGRVIRRLGRGRATGGLMLRVDGDHTRVSDLRTGRAYGTLPGVLPYGCTAAGDLLACPQAGGTTVWRVLRTAS
ncbi:PQQ-binding-like beta-propeller repeat protein [Actinoplanes teichomyceticus]|uniref:outer membrane protein assembly factor BamB family protein n=1 Tax=Actinoplanes teichomyceticus TaxID=1867 RepID=UPI0013DE2FAD|nr:PQQ-binding-like beta-propeller repeat protein [Actinoplanes teichomyceticus]